MVLGFVASIYRASAARYLQLANVTTRAGPRSFGRSILFDDKAPETPHKAARLKQDRAAGTRNENRVGVDKRLPRDTKGLARRATNSREGFVRAGTRSTNRVRADKGSFRNTKGLARRATNGREGFERAEKRRSRESVADGDSSRLQNGQKTLTTKTLQEKTKWHQSDAGQAHLRKRLNDLSLAGWQRRKIELKLKIGGEGWSPEKKIATSSMEKIRLLNAEFPEEWTMQRLSEQFKISQESVRRILKSKFQPSEAEIEEREDRRRQQMAKFKKGPKDGSSE
ncbi:Required for respiratory growth protein 9 mitochondrial [Coemansia sp. RSA 988]|nr:Required for respiratory growth protein 9 mitochondrial [Coemansia sp. RSA 988]